MPNDGGYFGQILRQRRRDYIQRLLTWVTKKHREDVAVPAGGRKGPPPDLAEHRRRVDGLLRIAQLQGQPELPEFLVQKQLEEKPGVLRERLRDPNPAVRWLAAQAVGRWRLPLGRELADLLSDREPEVAQAARQALVRLGRGTDFGPSLGASHAQRERAARRWREWLAFQDVPTRESAPGRLEFIPYEVSAERDRTPSRER